MKEATDSQKDTVHSEHFEQRNFVRHCRKELGLMVFAIPNGSRRSKSEAAKLKAEGVLAGVPDLFIPEIWTFVEMKRKKGGSVSQEQKKIMSELASIGYRCIVAKGCADAIEKIKKFYSPQ